MPTLWRRRVVRIAVEPVIHNEMIELLGPHQPGVGLAENHGLFVREFARMSLVIKLIRVTETLLIDFGERISEQCPGFGRL